MGWLSGVNLCGGKFKMVKSLRRGVEGSAAIARCAHRPGEMAEWLKAHAWKACVPQGTVGSNPTLSAIEFIFSLFPRAPSLAAALTYQLREFVRIAVIRPELGAA